MMRPLALAALALLFGCNPLGDDDNAFVRPPTQAEMQEIDVVVAAATRAIVAYQQQAIDSARATNGEGAASIADRTPVADCPSGGKVYASGHALASCPAGSPCTLSTFLRVETKAGGLPNELCTFPGQLVTEMSLVIEASGDESGYALTMDSVVSLFHLDGHLYDIGSCLGTLTASEPGARLTGSLCFAVDQPL